MKLMCDNYDAEKKIIKNWRIFNTEKYNFSQTLNIKYNTYNEINKKKH